MDHAASYYAATAHPSPARPPLEGDVRADVCVVGAGIAGCSAALDLAVRGYRVVLLEAHRVGWGASGRSGGQAIFGFGTSQKSIVAEVGLEDAHRMWDVSVEALELLRQRVKDHAIDCDLNWGHLHVATKQRQRRELAELQQELAETYGYRSPRLLERAERRVAACDAALLRRVVRPRQRPPAPAQLHTRAGARRRSGWRAHLRIVGRDRDSPRRSRAHRDRPRHRDCRLHRARARRLCRGPAHLRRLARDASRHLRRLDRTAR